MLVSARLKTKKTLYSTVHGKWLFLNAWDSKWNDGALHALHMHLVNSTHCMAIQGSVFPGVKSSINFQNWNNKMLTTTRGSIMEETCNSCMHGKQVCGIIENQIVWENLLLVKCEEVRKGVKFSINASTQQRFWGYLMPTWILFFHYTGLGLGDLKLNTKQ